MEFFKAHLFSIMCVLIIIWLIEVFLTQQKYKKNGVPLTGTIVDYKVAQNNFFPVFEFEYNGETLTVDSYQADKKNDGLGQTDTIYYLPGNMKGVFRERDLKPKAWMIFCGIAALAYIILDFAVLHH